jgi:hypothetical protein
MYGQLEKVTATREEADPKTASTRTSTAGFMAPTGLKANKQFYYDTDTGKAIPRAELETAGLHPNRALSKPTWSFDVL